MSKVEFKFKNNIITILCYQEELMESICKNEEKCRLSETWGSQPKGSLNGSKKQMHGLTIDFLRRSYRV